jgi:Tfp pilus assembly protein PilE
MSAFKLTARAFTVVELLAVVTIIIVLLALLSPAMDRAMEMTYRAICASNLHTTSIGLTHYALDQKYQLPQGYPSYDQATEGVYYIWARSTVSAGKAWRAHGALIEPRYTLPRVFYCPSNHHPNLQYDKASGLVIIVPEDPIVVSGKAGGWPSSGDPMRDEYQYVWTGYHYRSSFDGEPVGLPWRQAKLRKDPGHEPIMADVFSDPARGVTFHHAEGYTVLNLAGGARFVEDRELKVLNWNGGQQYFYTLNGHRRQKEVWEQFLARR